MSTTKKTARSMLGSKRFSLGEFERELVPAAEAAAQRAKEEAAGGGATRGLPWTRELQNAMKMAARKAVDEQRVANAVDALGSGQGVTFHNELYSCLAPAAAEAGALAKADRLFTDNVDDLEELCDVDVLEEFENFEGPGLRLGNNQVRARLRPLAEPRARGTRSARVEPPCEPPPTPLRSPARSLNPPANPSRLLPSLTGADASDSDLVGVRPGRSERCPYTVHSIQAGSIHDNSTLGAKLSVISPPRVGLPFDVVRLRRGV